MKNSIGFLIALSTLLGLSCSDTDRADCTGHDECSGERICRDGTCQSPDVVGMPDGGTSADGGSSDGGSDAQAPDAGADFSPSTIRLTNNGTTSIFYQDVDCVGEPSWFSLSDSNMKLRLLKSCGACTCSDLPDCEPVDCPGVCQESKVIELQTGESVDYEWPGYEWVADQVDGTMCERTVAPTATSLTAEFCFSTTDQPTGDGQLADPQCTSEMFDVGESTVELSVD